LNSTSAPLPVCKCPKVGTERAATSESGMGAKHHQHGAPHPFSKKQTVPEQRSAPEEPSHSHYPSVPVMDEAVHLLYEQYVDVPDICASNLSPVSEGKFFKEPTCISCEKRAFPLFSCECRQRPMEKYCSTDCFRAHFKKEHKKVCTKRRVRSKWFGLAETVELPWATPLWHKEVLFKRVQAYAIEHQTGGVRRGCFPRRSGTVSSRHNDCSACCPYTASDAAGLRRRPEGSHRVESLGAPILLAWSTSKTAPAGVQGSGCCWQLCPVCNP